MEMMTIGPLTGADALAYFHPPAAASAVPSATLTTISVRRNGRRAMPVIWADRVVDVFLVAVRGGDLKVDDAQRGRFLEDRAVRGDRLVPLLAVVQPVGARERALQVLRRGAAQGAWRDDELLQREGDERRV